jgi:hypothetical protein
MKEKAPQKERAPKAPAKEKGAPRIRRAPRKLKSPSEAKKSKLASAKNVGGEALLQDRTAMAAARKQKCHAEGVDFLHGDRPPIEVNIASPAATRQQKCRQTVKAPSKSKVLAAFLADIAAQVTKDMGGPEAGFKIWLAPLEHFDVTESSMSGEGAWDHILSNPFISASKEDVGS